MDESPNSSKGYRVLTTAGKLVEKPMNCWFVYHRYTTYTLPTVYSTYCIYSHLFAQFFRLQKRSDGQDFLEMAVVWLGPRNDYESPWETVRATAARIVMNIPSEIIWFIASRCRCYTMLTVKTEVLISFDQL